MVDKGNRLSPSRTGFRREGKTVTILFEFSSAYEASIAFNDIKELAKSGIDFSIKLLNPELSE